MTRLNAATRLVATDEGIADKAHYEQKIKSGQIKIVEGHGKRWQAGELPNGYFGVFDMGVTGQRSPLRAAGLGREAAVEAVKEANSKNSYHPTMTMR